MTDVFGGFDDFGEHGGCDPSDSPRTTRGPRRMTYGNDDGDWAGDTDSDDGLLETTEGFEGVPMQRPCYSTAPFYEPDGSTDADAAAEEVVPPPPPPPPPPPRRRSSTDDAEDPYLVATVMNPEYAKDWSPTVVGMQDVSCDPNALPWYHGAVNGDHAANALKKCRVGTFLVRHEFGGFWELLVHEADGVLGHPIKKIGQVYKFAAEAERLIKSKSMSGLIDIARRPAVPGWPCPLLDFLPHPKAAPAIVAAELKRQQGLHELYKAVDSRDAVSVQLHDMVPTVSSAPRFERATYDYEGQLDMESALAPVDDRAPITFVQGRTGLPRGSVGVGDGADGVPAAASAGSDTTLQGVRLDGMSIARRASKPHPYAKMPWFLGKADAKMGAAELRGKPDGTYLIRESPNRKGAYTLSLMMQERVIHVRVSSSSDPGSTMLFLGEVHMASTPTFKSLVELVQHYRTNMVAAECQTELKFPAKEIQRMSPRGLQMANSRRSTHAPTASTESYEYGTSM